MLPWVNLMPSVSGFHRCGRVYLAQSRASEIALHRMHSRGSLLRADLELIHASEDIAARWPMLAVDDVKVGDNCTPVFCKGSCLRSWLFIPPTISALTRSPCVKNWLLSRNPTVFPLSFIISPLRCGDL